MLRSYYNENRKLIVMIQQFNLLNFTEKFIIKSKQISNNMSQTRIVSLLNTKLHI